MLGSCLYLLHELKLDAKEWPDISDNVQSILNNCPLTLLNIRNNTDHVLQRTPQEVFKSLNPGMVLLNVVSVENYLTLTELEYIRALQLINIDRFHQTMNFLQKDFQVLDSKFTQKINLIPEETKKIRKVKFSMVSSLLLRATRKRINKKKFF